RKKCVQSLFSFHLQQTLQSFGLSCSFFQYQQNEMFRSYEAYDLANQTTIRILKQIYRPKMKFLY
ncbi:MAG: hypothetical protein LBC02_01805, partial [Planctomycetaceae bacterium]|nr:hypothetical protein [Planctomycetaceae bacterium]